jgi:hypothetical protein
LPPFTCHHNTIQYIVHTSIGEKLQYKQLQGFGNKTIIDGKEQTVGAGGKFGGVHLAMSDLGTQERNKAMLEAMFARERRKRNKEKKGEMRLKEEEEQSSS